MHIAHIWQYSLPRAQQFSFGLFSRRHYYFVNNISNGTTHSSLRVIKQYHWKHFFNSVFSFKWYATLNIQSGVDCLTSLNATAHYLMKKKEENLLIYTAQGSPFRRKKLSVISGSPEQTQMLFSRFVLNS